ncbi:MAG: TIGR04086 family membrane protein [Lachnospiraceae bacterium]|nr:TIGR04086 family membrane protein [Lachnospiraceae bacterium]
MEKTSTTGQKILMVIKTLILSYVMSGLILLLLAFLLYKFQLSEQAVKAGVLAVYVISCLAGGWYIGRKIGSRKFAWGFLAGILYFVVLLVVSMILNRSAVVYSQHLVTAFAMCILGGTIGGMIS